MGNQNNVGNTIFQSLGLDRSLNNNSDKIFFNRFSGLSRINVSTGGYLSNGYIYIEVKTDSDFEIFYKNILIFSANASTQKLISCLFENDGYLTVKGNCNELLILISGAEFISKKSHYFLPQDNMLVKCLGESYDVYFYESLSDIKQNHYNYEFSVVNLKCMQTFSINNSNYTGYLYFDGQLIFVSNMDNYTNKYIIIDKCIDATIIPDKQNNCIYIMYIKDNQLFYKLLDSSMSLSEEFCVDINFNGNLKSFSNIVIKNYGYPIFAVNLNNNKTLVLIIKNSKFLCRLVKKSINIEIFQDSTFLEIFTYDFNLLTISKYEIEEYSTDVCIVSKVKSKQIYNVDNVIKIDDKYLMYNGKYCTEVTNEELFGN